MVQLGSVDRIIKIFSAALVPLIAIITVIIIYLQLRLERRRWKSDLYDKRYQVYLAVREYLSYIAQNDNVTPKESSMFLIRTREAEFLYDEDVQQYLLELYHKGIDKMRYRHRLDNERLSDEKHKEMVNKDLELFDWFIKQVDVAKILFAKYLKIDIK